MKIETNTSGYYHVTFATQKGTTGQVSLGTNDAAKAAEMVEAMRVEELETVSGIVDLTHQVVTQIVAGKDLTVKDAIELWRKHLLENKLVSGTTLYANVGFTTNWAEESGVASSSLSSVKASDIIQYVNGGGERRSTALRKLSAIRSFFGFCQAEGYTYRNPASPSACKVTYDSFTHEEKETREREVFSDRDTRRLLEVADGRSASFWRSAIVLARDTGLRLGDIAQLEWASFKDGRLIVWTDKTNKRVDVPLTSDIMDSMGALSSTDIKYCFPEQRAIISDPKRRALLSVQFSRLCKKAGVVGKSFHSLRHTNATNLVTAGSSLEQVATRLGHGSTTVTAGYVHVGRA